MAIENFQKLLEIIDTLLGPNGCPWDRGVTVQQLEGYLLEEVHEVIEAIDTKDPDKIKEELGDLLFSSIFLPIVAQKEFPISLVDVINTTCEKLIRRHPHVFANVKVNNLEELGVKWEEIKSKEPGHKDRKSELEGIPKTLGALAKAQKVIQRLWHQQKISLPKEQISEEQFVQKMLQLILQAEKSGFSAESALQKAISKIPENL